MQAKAAQYLNMLAQLGVAGVRIDAAKHINKWDLGNILQVCIPSSRYEQQNTVRGCLFEQVLRLVSRPGLVTTVRIPGRVQA